MDPMTGMAIGGQVLGGGREIFVLGQDGAAAAGGDCLVAVEAQGAKESASASRRSVAAAADGLGRVFDQRDAELVTE